MDTRFKIVLFVLLSAIAIELGVIAHKLPSFPSRLEVMADPKRAYAAPVVWLPSDTSIDVDVTNHFPVSVQIDR